MSSHFHNARVIPRCAIAIATLVCTIFCTIACTRRAEPRHAALRVCADPNNLPFSNARGEGFENRIAELVALELGRSVEYTWWAQRRGFVRNTLKAGVCDVIIGVPLGFEMAATTRPYYHSTYVFVTRASAEPVIRTFDDARLKTALIGVQLIGDDFANTPPAHVLARRGIIRNVRGFTLYGDYRQQNPPARIIDAVARGEIDVAVAWGPLAGYFALREPVPLRVTPVSPATDPSGLPFVFGIAMGVRRADTALQRQLNAVLGSRGNAIDRILRAYGVPRTDTLPHRVVAQKD
jgi:mxaJ protein